MADDLPAFLAAFYEQQRILEEQGGPRVQEIRACGEMLEHVLSMLEQRAAPVPNALRALSGIGAIPLVRDDTLPDYIVRLVHADGSRRDVAVYRPIACAPECPAGSHHHVWASRPGAEGADLLGTYAAIEPFPEDGIRWDWWARPPRRWRRWLRRIVNRESLRRRKTDG
jgi:hypothetical protein